MSVVWVSPRIVSFLKSVTKRMNQKSSRSLSLARSSCFIFIHAQSSIQYTLSIVPFLSEATAAAAVVAGASK
jgi:hypothetical protein